MSKPPIHIQTSIQKRSPPHFVTTASNPYACATEHLLRTLRVVPRLCKLTKQTQTHCPHSTNLQCKVKMTIYTLNTISRSEFVLFAKRTPVCADLSGLLPEFLILQTVGIGFVLFVGLMVARNIRSQTRLVLGASQVVMGCFCIRLENEQILDRLKRFEQESLFME